MTSKLKTDVLETVSGSGTIALTNQLSGMTSASVPSGSVLQVVSVTKSDTWTTSSQSFVDIAGLSVGITPHSTSSKILVAVHFQGDSQGHASLKIVRDSTDIAIGDAQGNATRATFHTHAGTNDWNTEAMSISHLDAPSTTSTVTYKLQGAVPYSASYVLYVNRTSNLDTNTYNGMVVSSITLTEIKG
tara:strand:+ start:239 stop:802 length:564 start_codon:yes stop_codon:yes gene_type:complete